jgi:hypothetical protein
MDWRLFGAEIFAILASWLILTVPGSSATSVKIYSDINPATPMSTVTYNPYSLIRKDVVINPPWGSPTLSLGISNSSIGVLVEEVLLYRCRGFDPSTCMGMVTKEQFSQGDLTWTSLAEQTASYPQEANIMVLVRMNEQGRVFWTGLWIEIVRSGEQDFDVQYDDLDSLKLFVSDIGAVNMIREFILNNHMIPFNPQWISSMVLEGSGSIHKLGLESQSVEEIAGDAISLVSDDHSFLIPEAASGIANPIVVYNSPDYVCGDSQCDSANGESSSNCCLDCSCTQGYYCDSSRGCRSEAGIGLELYGEASLGVSNCYHSHDLTVPVEIDNAPTGTNVKSAWYSIKGSLQQTSCSKLSGDLYSCPVVVQPVPGCTEGVFSLGPNKLGMEISFPDGSGSKSRSLELDLPFITIGSFICGQRGCELDVGEGPDLCCYDCGCPSGYCDYLEGSPAIDASCRRDFDGLDIRAVSMAPRHFQVFSSTGETVEMNVVIDNAPRSLSVTETACSMGCSSGGVGCTSTCSMACSEAASGDPGKYNSTCTLSVGISGYSPGSDYTLSPRITYSVRHNNGSSVVTRDVVKDFGQISAGAHWCGDGDCTADESQDDCCFDCGCPAGDYCDTLDVGGPTQGDACKPLAGRELVIVEIGSRSLVDSTVEHVVPIKARVEDPPSGFELSGSCSIANNTGIPCEIYCSVAGSDVLCELLVPPIDYLTTGQQYYIPGSRMLVLTENEYALKVEYNDGSDRVEDVYEKNLGSLEIEVTSHCGEGGCEAGLGETQATCCRDCGCSEFGAGYFCYTGKTPRGECVDNSSILLEILSIEPQVLECLIGSIGGKCRFVNPVQATLQVINPPSDLEVGEGYAIIEEQSVKMECDSDGDITCSFVPGDFEGSVGEGNHSLLVGLQLVYSMNGVEVTQNVSASTSLGVIRKKSDALNSCEDELARINQQIEDLKGNRDSYESFANLMMIVGILLMVAFGACIYCSCFGCSFSSSTPASPTAHLPTPGPVAMDGHELPPGPDLALSGGVVSFTFCAALCLPIMTMATTAIMMSLSIKGQAANTESQIASLEQQRDAKEQMCSADAFAPMASAVSAMAPLPSFQVN